MEDERDVIELFTLMSLEDYDHNVDPLATILDPDAQPGTLRRCWLRPFHLSRSRWEAILNSCALTAIPCSRAGWRIDCVGDGHGGREGCLEAGTEK